MPQNTFCRKEKKLLVDEAIVPLLQQDLQEYMTADKHNVDGRPYCISNLYFDNDANSILHHSVNKPNFKQKLRMRSYGIPEPDSTVFLEIKQKTLGVGTKRRVTMTLKEANDYLLCDARPPSLSPLEAQILHEIDWFRQTYHPFPKIYISYMRNAYYGKDNSAFRVTLDRNILVRHHDLDLALGRYGDSLLPQGKQLLEIKLVGAVPLWFARIMSKYRLSFTSFSKSGVAYQQHHLANLQIPKEGDT